jgi:hypothetical protein
MAGEGMVKDGEAGVHTAFYLGRYAVRYVI